MYKVLIIGILTLFCVQDGPTIAWNASKKVTWNDFKGTPDRDDDVIAVTASGLSFGYSTKRYSSGRIDYDFNVTAHFYPDKSWYKKELSTDHTLAHERLHFDITELHARKFRQRVRNTKFTANIEREMDQINQQINQDLRAMQQLYDKESEHSRNLDMQKVWQRYVEEQLFKFRDFQ